MSSTETVWLNALIQLWCWNVFQSLPLVNLKISCSTSTLWYIDVQNITSPHFKDEIFHLVKEQICYSRLCIHGLNKKKIRNKKEYRKSHSKSLDTESWIMIIGIHANSCKYNLICYLSSISCTKNYAHNRLEVGQCHRQTLLN